MKGILWISGIGVDATEMEELRKTIRKINRKRKAKGHKKLDYVCMAGKRTYLNAELANREKKEA